MICYLCRRDQPDEKLDERRCSNRISCLSVAMQLRGRPAEVSKRAARAFVLADDQGHADLERAA